MYVNSLVLFFCDEDYIDTVNKCIYGIKKNKQASAPKLMPNFVS